MKILAAGAFCLAVVSLLGFMAGFDIFFVVSFFGVAVLTVAKIAHREDYHTKGRQILHLTAGISLVYIIKIWGMGAGLFVSGLALIVALLLSEAVASGIRVPLVNEIVEKFERREIRPMTGVIYYAMGSLLTILVFGNQNAVFAGILALAFLDSFATGFGVMFGKVEFIKNRSVEGILAGFVGCYLICSTFLPAPSAFTVAIVGSAVDVAGLPVDDNLTIPLITAATVFV